jgi:hypothetical protein
MTVSGPSPIGGKIETPPVIKFHEFQNFLMKQSTKFNVSIAGTECKSLGAVWYLMNGAS